MTFLRLQALLVAAAFSVVIVIVCGHGIQHPVKPSQRALQYENHPFQSAFASSTRSLLHQTTTAQQDNSYLPVDHEFVEIRSQLVPPLSFDNSSNINNSNYSNYTIATIGSFVLKSSSNNTFASNTTTTATAVMKNYKPIRLAAFMSSNYAPFLSEERWKLLQASILQPALTAWSDAIHTIPVVSNLTLDTSQLLDRFYCGSDPISRIRIPSQHLTEGVPNVDTVLYVTLGFAPDWLLPPQQAQPTPYVTSPANESSLFKDKSYVAIVRNETELLALEDPSKGHHPSSSEEIYDTTHAETRWSFNDSDTANQQQNASQGTLWNATNGGADTTTALSPPPCAFLSNINILASAEFCNTDQFDRPTVGVLHLCLSEDLFFQDEDYAAKTVVHEIGHVLGFNAISMAYLRNAFDGSPRTKRDPDGNVPFSNVTCGGTDQTISVPLPSSDTIRFATRRNGVQVAEIVTESVAMVVRNQFDCPLSGAELESPLTSNFASNTTSSSFQQQQEEYYGLVKGPLENDDDPKFCIGSHWSRRLFQADIMNPVVDNTFDGSSDNNATLLSHYKWMFSPLTLAYFVDTGWYRINPARISNVQHGWGRGAGCDFIERPCIDPSTGDVPKLNQPFYCNQPFMHSTSSSTSHAVHGCTEDFSRKAVCELYDYGPIASAISNATSQHKTTIPKEFRYFDNPLGDSLTASFAAAMQFAPQNGLEYTHTGSASSSNVDLAADSKHIWGGADPDAEYCPYYRGFSNGLCSLPETVNYLKTDDAEEFGPNSRCVVAYKASRMTGLCMPIACVVSDRSLRIQVDGLWTKCSYAGEIIKLRWWTDQSYIVCPDPARTCPTFWCRQNCLGSTNGVCDYKTGQCMCPFGVSSLSPSNIASTDPAVNRSAVVQKNITLFPCDTDLYDDDYDSSSRHRWDRPDADQFVRMELALSQYYVADSAVLTNEPMSLFNSFRRFFSRESQLEVFASLIAIFLTIFGIGFGIRACCYPRFQKQQWWRSLCRKVRRRSQPSDDDHSSPEKNVVVSSAAKLVWLGQCLQDHRKIRPIDSKYSVENNTMNNASQRIRPLFCDDEFRSVNNNATIDEEARMGSPSGTQSYFRPTNEISSVHENTEERQSEHTASENNNNNGMPRREDQCTLGDPNSDNSI